MRTFHELTSGERGAEDPVIAEILAGLTPRARPRARAAS